MSKSGPEGRAKGDVDGFRAAVTTHASYDLQNLIAVVRRQAWFIVTVVAICIALGQIYLFIATPQYTATARLVIDTRAGKISDVSDVVLPLTGDISAIESQVEILRSRRIAARVLGMANDEIDDKLLQQFMRAITIERQGLSLVVDVSFRSADRTRSAQTANAIVDAFLADQIEVKRLAAQNASDRLKDSITKVAGDLRSIEERIEKHLATYGTFDAGDLQLTELTISRQMEQVDDARTKAELARERLTRLEELRVSPDLLLDPAEPGDWDAITDLRRQLAERQSKVDALLQQGGERNPAVKAARADLEAAKKSALQEITRLHQQAAAEDKVQKAQLKQIADRVAELWKYQAERRRRFLSYTELGREMEASQQLQASLFKRLGETEVQKTLQAADAWLVAYATPPSASSYPRIIPTLAAIFLGSLLVGAAAALVRENLAR